MKLVSFDDHEAGLLAIGGSPVGVVAIGMAPVGVVAIGVLPVGLVSLACGAGAGGVVLMCGVGVGVRVNGVGMGVSAWGEVLGGGVTLAETSTVNVRVPVEKRYHAHAEGALSPAERLTSPEPRAWTHVEVARENGAWGLTLAGAPLQLGEAARAKLDAARDGKVQAAVARVRREEEADRDAGRAYRDAPARQVTWVADDVELDDGEERVEAREELDVLGLFWKVPLFVLLMGLVLYRVHYAIDDLSLDRRAAATWPAKVTASTRRDLAPGAVCAVEAALRSDGKVRHKAAVTITCEGKSLYAPSEECDAILLELPTDQGHVYSLSCGEPGRKPEKDDDHDRPGRPEMVVETGKTRAALDYPYGDRWSVALHVEQWSAPVRGPRLLDPPSGK